MGKGVLPLPLGEGRGEGVNSDQATTDWRNGLQDQVARDYVNRRAGDVVSWP